MVSSQRLCLSYLNAYVVGVSRHELRSVSYVLSRGSLTATGTHRTACCFWYRDGHGIQRYTCVNTPRR